jgi:hypothetical protein
VKSAAAPVKAAANDMMEVGLLGEQLGERGGEDLEGQGARGVWVQGFKGDGEQDVGWWLKMYFV